MILTQVLSGYLFLWFTFFVVILLDWLFGLDKISSYLDKRMEHSSFENEQIYMPLVGAAVFGILIGILYLCTGADIFRYGSYIMSALSLGGFILIAVLYVLYRILLLIRNFFIHLRKGA